MTRMVHRDLNENEKKQETPMLNRTILFALGTALAVALAPVAASAKAGHHGGGHGGKGGHGKHAHHHHHKHHHHKHARWHRGKTIILGTGVATGVATYAATTGSCNCLTKSYLENGTVVFKDLCTQEMAMNPPAEKQAQN
jgi:ABC-type Zn2+ transport system substrate-binding protein/surface adhesin